MNPPEPLIPPDVDLRDFQFMPLDVRRLRDSKLVAVRTPEEVVAAIMLWSASWHQVPAASLPDDDVELSALAGYGGVRGVQLFRQVKDGALYGFVRCSDGRWYHPVVAEKAADGWNGKLDQQHYRASERIRKENIERAKRGGSELPKPAKPEHLSGRLVDGITVYRQWNSTAFPAEANQFPAEVTQSSAGIPPESANASSGIPLENDTKGEGEGEGQGQGQGQGQGKDKEKSVDEFKAEKPGNGHDLLGQTDAAKSKRPRKPARHALTDGWYPSDGTIEWLNQFIADKRLSTDWAQHQHSLFVGKAKANGWVYADWDAAYRNFVRENGPGGRYWRATQ